MLGGAPARDHAAARFIRSRACSRRTAWASPTTPGTASAISSLRRSRRAALASAREALDALVAEGLRRVRGRASAREQVRSVRRLDLRYAGTETALSAARGTPRTSSSRRFTRQHERTFGYARPEHPIELVDGARRGRGDARARRRAADARSAARRAPVASAHGRLFLHGRWLDAVPVFDRETLGAGARIAGPALLLDATGTLRARAGFVASVRADGVLRARATIGDTSAPARPQRARSRAARGVQPPVHVHRRADGRRAQAHGALHQHPRAPGLLVRRLRRERRAGRQRAAHPGAPRRHGRVGARPCSRRIPRSRPATCSSPTIRRSAARTCPTSPWSRPCTTPDGRLRFLCASRGHHADIGGITPGSMPPDSTLARRRGRRVLGACASCIAAHFDRERVLRVLGAGPIPRAIPTENLADLEAQIAANHTGARLLARARRALRLATW